MGSHTKVSPRKGPHLLYRRFGLRLCVAHFLTFLFREALCFRLVVFNIEVHMRVSEERVTSSHTGGSDCAICVSFGLCSLSFVLEALCSRLVVFNVEVHMRVSEER